MATEVGSLTNIIKGDSPVEQGRSVQASSQSSKNDDGRSVTGRTERQRNEFLAKVHRESNGVYAHDRRGVAFCKEFQTGWCLTGRGLTCPHELGAPVQQVSGERQDVSSCNLVPRGTEPWEGWRKKVRRGWQAVSVASLTDHREGHEEVAADLVS